MKHAGFIAMIIVIVLIVVALTRGPQDLEEVAISGVIERVNKGEVAKIEQQGSDLRITPQGQEEATEVALLPADTNLVELGADLSRVEYSTQKQSNTGQVIGNVALTFLPVMVLSLIHI